MTNLKRIGEYVFAPGSLRILRPKNAAGKNVRMTVDEVLASPAGASVKALMAAPMYGHTSVGPCKPGGLTPCTRQFDIVTKVDLPSCRKQSGFTFSVVPFTRQTPGFFMPECGSFIAVQPTIVVEPGATLGLQVYPTLVWNQINKGKRTRLSSVAGLGLIARTGQFLYIVASGGTLYDLGALFLERGCDYAGYCDAGSSAALYVVGEGWRGVHAKGVRGGTWKNQPHDQGPKLPAWLAVM